MAIPKVIHYIWLGGNPEPKILEKCKKSWKKYCPDYEIKRWDESNLNINENDYTRQACEAKKYAFASDYFRYKILYEEGGVYLDVDVKLLKNIDDLLSKKCFLGFEKGNNIAVGPGLVCASEAGSEIIKELMEDYNGEQFLNPDGSINKTTVCERTTKVLVSHGLKIEDKTQEFENFTVFASEYFCPMSFDKLYKKITKNTYSIHLYYASWMKHPTWERIKYRIKKIIGQKNANRLKNILKKDKKSKNNEQN